MVKYPIVKPGAKSNTAKKATVKVPDSNAERDTSAYSNRGMRLENQINLTCEFYQIHNMAVIYKKPTPIRVVSFKHINSRYAISEAYFQQASTTDYNGVYRGKYIDFEAKETKTHASFNLDNLPEHQMKHMLQVQEHGGIAFVIVCFWRSSEIFLMDAKIMAEYYYDKKYHSIPLKAFRERACPISSIYTRPIDFLPAIDKHYFDKD